MEFKHEENGSQGKIILLENGNHAGEIHYILAEDNKIIIDHTETFEGFSGKGYGRKLVEKAAEFAKNKGFKIIPSCSYARSEMQNDPEMSQLIAK